MPYITREDGERFVIPSYRDTISAKKASLLKKEVTLLSATYGEYVTFQKKGVTLYEVAFSADAGYLLGECVWHHFKRPPDMVYCEAIPNTFEAILVIVKAGSVYLDGTFPVDSIPDELVVFKTQQNSFNIYVYGDVPISQTPEPGKFSFDASSVKSFSVLDNPVFPTLQGIKTFQLQLVDVALKAQGVGALPVKQIAIVAIVVVVIFVVYELLTSQKQVQEALPIASFTAPVNPYQSFLEQLNSPDPSDEMDTIFNSVFILNTIPGWSPGVMTYTPGLPAKLRAKVTSKGIKVDVLYAWAYKNNVTIEMLPDGYYATVISVTRKRPPPNKIYQLRDVITNLVDTLSVIMPESNNLSFTAFVDKRVFSQTVITLTFSELAPATYIMMADYLKGYPLVITQASISESDTGFLSGQIVFTALGN
jgi:hypothetical protein